MKRLITPGFYKYAFTVLLLTITRAIAWAQDSTVASSTSTKTTTSTTQTWYAEPWVWAVGGIVLLLLIVLLVRGGGSRTDKVTVTKTRSTD